MPKFPQTSTFTGYNAKLKPLARIMRKAPHV